MPDNKPEAKPFLPPGMLSPMVMYLNRDPSLRALVEARDDAWRQELARADEAAVAAYRERVVAMAMQVHEMALAKALATADLRQCDEPCLDRARALIQEVRLGACPGRTTPEPR
jgi:hypothetical protein